MIYLGIDIGGSSVKSVLVEDGRMMWRRHSDPYRRPERGALVAAVRQSLGDGARRAESVGLCVPGLLDDARQRVTLSVNVPGLTGSSLPDLAGEALDRIPPPPLVLCTDANAAADDLYASRNLTGRLLVLSIGTGVGAAVMDPGPHGPRPLSVDGDSPGHLGQCDVSCDDNPPIGPDGGRGSLEGYLGAEALARSYGPDLVSLPSRLRPEDPPMRALVRAVRVGHAIYRPHHVCLAGGLGIRLGPLLPLLRIGIERELTRVARPGWTFTTGDHDFHAAAGAARLAARRGGG